MEDRSKIFFSLFPYRTFLYSSQTIRSVFFLSLKKRKNHFRLFNRIALFLYRHFFFCMLNVLPDPCYQNLCLFFHLRSASQRTLGSHLFLPFRKFRFLFLLGGSRTWKEEKRIPEKKRSLKEQNKI